MLGATKSKEALPANGIDNQGNIKQRADSEPINSLATSTIVPPLKRKTLILDLDETLVHSTVKPVTHHHLIVDVIIDGVPCIFYVIKRPHVDLFLQKVCIRVHLGFYLTGSRLQSGMTL